jgi:hypothetical protein
LTRNKISDKNTIAILVKIDIDASLRGKSEANGDEPTAALDER